MSFVGSAVKLVTVDIVRYSIAVPRICLTLSFVCSLRLAKLNEEMKESDYGIQGSTYFGYKADSLRHYDHAVTYMSFNVLCEFCDKSCSASVWLGLVKAHPQMKLVISIETHYLVDFLTTHDDVLLVSLGISGSTSLETVPTFPLQTAAVCHRQCSIVLMQQPQH